MLVHNQISHTLKTCCYVFFYYFGITAYLLKMSSACFYHLLTYLSVICVALGEAQAKVNVYEKELSSAQKTIAKSKKAQEVQQILKNNESLQHKLLSQEEEFRLQNQTLLEELTKVGQFRIILC